MHIVGAVAEIVVFLQKSTCFCVILLAGHDEKRHIRLRLIGHLFQIVDQTLKDIQIPCLSHVVHSLGMVESQPGTLTACQQNGAHFCLPDRPETDLPVFF